MSGIAFLRDGAFVTAARLRAYPLLLLCGFAGGILYLLLTAHGIVDYAGRPLGSDFSSFYAAGRLVLAGRTPYDQIGLYAMEQALFGAHVPFYSFAYPPIFLLIVTPLAKLPYLWALALWQGASLVLYLAALRLLWLRMKGPAVPAVAFFIAALAYTGVFVNLIHGQNALLVAALFAFALALLDTNAVLAGTCFGLIAFKPQMGLLIPFALAAGGRWRSFAGAAATVALLVIASTALFGAASWSAFFAATRFSQHAILDDGAVGYEKMVSVFAWMRLWHLPLWVSYVVQALTSLGVIAAILRTWSGKADFARLGALLCLGSLLITPFALAYDLMVMAPALVMMAARGARAPYEASLVAFLWLIPAAAEGAGALFLPLAAWGLILGFAFNLKDASSRP